MENNISQEMRDLVETIVNNYFASDNPSEFDFTIYNLEDFQIEILKRYLKHVWRLLLIGDPGAGKTFAYAHFPKPMLVCDFDRKFEEVYEYYPELQDADIDVKEFGPKSFPAFQKVWGPLGEGCPYKTVVLDSLTYLARAIINYMFSIRGSAAGEMKGTIPIMGLDEYKGESSALSTIMTQGLELADRGVNFILTAHLINTTEFVASGSKITGTRPKRTLLTGGSKPAAEIPGAFKDIYYITPNQGINADDPREFHAVTKPTEYDMARTAKRRLPVRVDYTHPKKLYNELLIHLSRKEENV